MKNLIKDSNQGGGTKTDCIVLINSLTKEVISGGIRAKKSGRTISKKNGKVIGAVKAIDKERLDNSSQREKCYSFWKRFFFNKQVITFIIAFNFIF